MGILACGSIGYDDIESDFGRRKNLLGGSLTYFSLASSLFTDVKIVGVVGSDFKKKDLKIFIEKNIDISGLHTLPGKTFRWSGSYKNNPNEAKTLKTCLNVFERFNPVIPQKIKKNNILFLANIDPDLQRSVMNQVTSKIIACDTMNYWLQTKLKSLIELLKNIDIFFINDAEAKRLSNQNNLILSAKKILKFGPKFVIIKKGEHGSLLFAKDFYFCLPSYPVEKVVDPTGAGDSFAGGFLGYLDGKTLNKKNLKTALSFATVVASFTVEDFGVKKLLSINKKLLQQRLRNIFAGTVMSV